MKSKDLFFRDDKFIGWFFARPATTLRIFFYSGVVICLLVWLIPYFGGQNLGSIVLAKGSKCNVGFFYRPNWGLMYAIILPLIFWLMSSILAESTLTVKALSSPEISVIEPAQVTNDQSFEDSLYLTMRGWKVLINVVAAAAALTATGVTIYLLLTNPSATGDDWAERMPLFAVFIFVVQGVYIFLGVFWVLKFASFITSFVWLTLRETAAFRLNLMLYDPERRMGLGMIGGLLNRFAVAAFLFECYVAVYGLQASADIHGLCLVEYIQGKFNPNAIPPTFSLEAFWLPLHFRGAGVLALFTLSMLLWIVYIAIPIFYLHPRLNQMREAAWQHHARELESANRENNEARVKPLEREFEALRANSSWPNGPTIGIGLTVVLFVVPLLAFPFGSYLVSSGILLALYKVAKELKSWG